MKRRRQGRRVLFMFLIGPALESIASGQRPYGLDTLLLIGPYLNNTTPLAFATRRVESIPAAHAILKRAASLHPTDSTIQFNLACYEAQSADSSVRKRT